MLKPFEPASQTTLQLPLKILVLYGSLVTNSTARNSGTKHPRGSKEMTNLMHENLIDLEIRMKDSPRLSIFWLGSHTVSKAPRKLRINSYRETIRPFILRQRSAKLLGSIRV